MDIRQQILDLQDVEIKQIEVPEWGLSVNLKCMSGTDRNSFESEVFLQKTSNYENIYAKILVRCICDDKGNRLFTNEDTTELGKKSSRVLKRLSEQAQSLSGLLSSDVEELKKT